MHRLRSVLLLHASISECPAFLVFDIYGKKVISYGAFPVFKFFVGSCYQAQLPMTFVVQVTLAQRAFIHFLLYTL